MSQEVKTVLIIGVITVALIVGGIFFLSKSSPSTPGTSSVPVDTKILIKPDSHKIGSDSAKVSVVEFGDYECPACGAAQPVTKQIIQNYAGKILYVFRNFPLPQHEKALVAAEAAEAAGVQGKFWEMHDKLYETQDTWSTSDKPLDLFVGYALGLGLDVNKFKDDVNNNKYQDKITQDYQDGVAVGLRATPTFFINGQRLEGVPTYEEFKKQIDAAIAK